jgi:hypothetical protein
MRNERNERDSMKKIPNRRGNTAPAISENKLSQPRIPSKECRRVAAFFITNFRVEQC